MRFLADMGVSMEVVQWLRARQHEVRHLMEEALQRLPNGEIFRKAVAENRVILTFDLDFGEIAALSKDRRTGVVLFRLHNTRATHVIDRLAAAISEAEPDLHEGAVVLVEETRLRTRRLP